MFQQIDGQIATLSSKKQGLCRRFMTIVKPELHSFSRVMACIHTIENLTPETVQDLYTPDGQELLDNVQRLAAVIDDIDKEVCFILFSTVIFIPQPFGPVGYCSFQHMSVHPYVCPQFCQRYISSKHKWRKVICSFKK